MLDKVIEYINDNELIKAEDKILVALSGGPDSVCMLHILYKLKDMLNRIRCNTYKPYVKGG